MLGRVLRRTAATARGAGLHYDTSRGQFSPNVTITARLKCGCYVKPEYDQP